MFVSLFVCLFVPKCPLQCSFPQVMGRFIKKNYQEKSPQEQNIPPHNFFVLFLCETTFKRGSRLLTPPPPPPTTSAPRGL